MEPALMTYEEREETEEVFPVVGELVIRYKHPNERLWLLTDGEEQVYSKRLDGVGTFGNYCVYLRNMRRS